jgi:hypothetical protein
MRSAMGLADGLHDPRQALKHGLAILNTSVPEIVFGEVHQAYL